MLLKVVQVYAVVGMVLGFVVIRKMTLHYDDHRLPVRYGTVMGWFVATLMLWLPWLFLRILAWIMQCEDAKLSLPFSKR